jgi:hypothetical protein
MRVAAFLALWVLPAPAVGQAAGVQAFFDMLHPDEARALAAERTIIGAWDDGHAAMLVELMRVAPGTNRASIISLLERGTGQSFGTDLDRWWDWIWRTDPEAHEDYATFKAELYAVVDPSFREYFDGEPAATIRLDEVRWGGVQRDGIPPLDLPDLTGARGARYLDDDNIVFGAVVNGEARAYPKRIMAWHEMVKDTIGGEHFTGVYCTLCGSMILYRSTIDGEHHELGTSGFLYRSNKLMYDHATRSLWSTLTGGPVVGPLAERNIALEPLSVVTTTWGEWRRRHRDTRVLSIETGYQRDYSEGAAYREYFATDELMFSVPELDTRLANKAEVLALRFPEAPDEQLAIAVEYLEARPVYHDRVGGIELVVLTDVTGANRVYAADGLRFERWDARDRAWDEQGRLWSVEERALTSPDGVELRRLPSHNAFWFGWFAQFPETRLVY